MYIFIIENKIGAEGGRALVESLKQNTTLTQLNLESMSKISVWLFKLGGSIQLTRIFVHVSENDIGDEGARALAESLKQNATLTQLNLGSMSEISVW